MTGQEQQSEQQTFDVVVPEWLRDGGQCPTVFVDTEGQCLQQLEGRRLAAVNDALRFGLDACLQGDFAGQRLLRTSNLQYHRANIRRKSHAAMDMRHRIAARGHRRGAGGEGIQERLR